MKRIEFIAPVEAMRGNLSGRQDLLYAENDNKAFYGPLGTVNYARNYSPRFIGAKVAKTGKKYFAVRTKSANHLTAKAKYAMALLGGTGAIVGSIMRQKGLTPYVEAYAQWIELQNLGNTKTFRQQLTDWVRTGLKNKSAQIAFSGPRTVYSIINPWIATNPETGQQTVGAEIPEELIWKFAEELGPNHLVKLAFELTSAVSGKHSIVMYQVSNATWGAQNTEGGAMGVGGSPLGSMGLVDGALVSILRQTPDNAQVKIGFGAEVMSPTPLWETDGETEEAVQSSDSPTTDVQYVAHPAV